MSLQDLTLWLAQRRAADEHKCQCGHTRGSHIDRVAGCNHSKCMCASFRRDESEGKL